jgi:cytochrome c6
MNATNSRRLLMLMVVMAMAGALVVAGCGGSGGTTSADQNPPSNETPETEKAGSETESGAEEGMSEESEGMSEGESMKQEEGMSEGETGGAEAGGGSEEMEGEEAMEGGAGGAAMAEGMTVFTTNCGSCHTLKAAGTTGNVGPNLDELMPSESTVEMQVINGGGPMPAFGKEEILSEEEVKAVSAYVSSEAGK